jgi:hypothetical protein
LTQSRNEQSREKRISTYNSFLYAADRLAAADIDAIRKQACGCSPAAQRKVEKEGYRFQNAITRVYVFGSDEAFSAAKAIRRSASARPD